MATTQGVFSEHQLRQILRQALGDPDWQLTALDVKPAAEGLSGFLGDHSRVTLRARRARAGGERAVHVFVKRMPRDNLVKAVFIDEGNFFRREMLMFRLFEQLGGLGGLNPWRTEAYICDESIVVMPDLAVQGYSSRPYLETLDLPHLLLAAASMARFHAAFANFAHRTICNGHGSYNFLEEHGHVMADPTFRESPWLRAAAKLSADLLKTFSSPTYNIPAVEEKLGTLFVEACDCVGEYKETLNVVLHRDLWVNNIMFRCEGGVPTSALLIDFQCIRYGPPAFDLMILLYLTTDRAFREGHEREICRHYFSVFLDALKGSTKQSLVELKYDLEQFMVWCDRARMFGMVSAIGILPYVLMSPLEASRHFDDPRTYLQYLEERSAPVLEHARNCAQYRDRQLQVIEEFMDRYLLKQLSKVVAVGHS